MCFTTTVTNTARLQQRQVRVAKHTHAPTRGEVNTPVRCCVERRGCGPRQPRPSPLNMRCSTLALFAAVLACAPSPASPLFTCCTGQHSCGGVSNDPVTCAALGDLYNATNGPAWNVNNGWSHAAAGYPIDYCSFFQTYVTWCPDGQESCSSCAGGVLTMLCVPFE